MNKIELRSFCPNCNSRLDNILLPDPEQVVEIEQIALVIGKNKLHPIPFKGPKVGKIKCPSCKKPINIFVGSNDE